MQEQKSSGSFVFQQITDSYRPASPEEAVKRSLFFCHAVHAHVKQNLVGLLGRAKGGEFGVDVREQVEKSVDDWVFGEALKEITSTCIHLTGMAQGGPKAPIWLIRLLLESQKETDDIFPEPSAQEIIERRGSMAGKEMLDDLVAAVGELLGLPEGRGRQQLAVHIEQAQPLIGELLVFSLTQPLEVLTVHLAKYS